MSPLGTSDRLPLRKRIAGAALALFLLTVSPPVLAMATLEGRQLRLSSARVIVLLERRKRALERRYGMLLDPFVPFSST